MTDLIKLRAESLPRGVATATTALVANAKNATVVDTEGPASPTRMERNLWMRKWRPCKPTRVCRKNTGPGESIRIATEITTKRGASRSSPKAALTTSRTRVTSDHPGRVGRTRTDSWGGRHARRIVHSAPTLRGHTRSSPRHFRPRQWSGRPTANP